MANMCRLDMKPASMSRSFKLSNGNMNFLSLSCKYEKREKSLNDRIESNFYFIKQTKANMCRLDMKPASISRSFKLSNGNMNFLSLSCRKEMHFWVAVEICMSKKQRVSCDRFLRRTHARPDVSTRVSTLHVCAPSFFVF